VSTYLEVRTHGPARPKRPLPVWAYVRRIEKADKLATYLRDAGYGVAQVARFTRADWQRVAVDAGVAREPSGETCRIVGRMLAGSELDDARCPTCGLGDPDGRVGPRQKWRHPGVCSQ
jgi:hypothetical protein